MALIKEPYGLVYNTDGSLCTTYRDDDIPFQGVKSFAVEEATENLIDIYNYATQISRGNMTIEQTDYKGQKALKVTVTGDDPYTRLGFNTNQTLTPGSVFTGSVYVESYDVKITNTMGKDCNIYFTNSGFYGFYGSWHTSSMVNNRLITVLDNPEDSGLSYPNFKMCVFFFQPGVYYVYNPQLENKPFATSYVEGSRPMGYMQFVDERFDRNNLVIAQWKKTISTDTQLYSATFFGRYRDDYSDFYGYFGWRRGYGLYLYTTEGSTCKYVDFNTIYNQWVFEVFVIDGLTARYKTLGENIDEMLTTSLTGVKPWNNMIYYQAHSKYNIGLISNIFIGKYRKPDGTVIWTDDYIREVYEAQIPFAVSNKLSIY